MLTKKIRIWRLTIMTYAYHKNPKQGITLIKEKYDGAEVLLVRENEKLIARKKLTLWVDEDCYLP